MPYALGYDFGSESARCLLVNVQTGHEAGCAVHPYRHGVMTTALPTGEKLGADWALQDPRDWLECLEVTTRAVLRDSGIPASAIIGIGTACTACTVLPTRRDGTPLMYDDHWAREPHAWCKLWKHHAAQDWADRITALAHERKEPWLATYGGKISSEWLLPKVAQVAAESPTVARAAEQWVEAADWIVWQLTGVQTRNACCAGYKGLWDAERGWPTADFTAAVHPGLADLAEKLGPVLPIGQRAGTLTAAMATRLGLHPGIPVAVGIIDAHAALPACTATAAGDLVAIMGTSCCHIVCAEDRVVVPGMCGVVKDGALPGLYGYEAGQAGFGDHFAWLSRLLGAGDPGHAALARDAAALGPAGSGLLALDWWNGNRSTLVDAHLSGVLVGLTLDTTPAQIYRALIEGLACGTRVIIEALTAHGVPVQRIIASGGLPEKNPLLMQVMADVTGRTIQVARSAQAGAVGAAIFGALAAGCDHGGHDDLSAAAAAMGGLQGTIYAPEPAHAPRYQALFSEYQRLYSYFGSTNSVMHALRAWAKPGLG